MTTKTIVHKISTSVFHIEGTSSLICHRFSEKARKEMLDKQMKKKIGGKEAKDPERDYLESLYPLSNGKGYGHPATAFKNAAVRAGKALDIPMTDIRSAMHVNGQDGDLIVIKGKPSPREDVVRLQGKSSDIRFRGEFLKWSAKIEVDYDPNVLGSDEMLAIFSRAGKFVGVGEWRIEKNGVHGTWDVKKVEEIR